MEKLLKNELCNQLERVDWYNNANNVQEMWNDFENILIEVVDLLAPLSEFKGELLVQKPCPIIKGKLNFRNRLLKIQKQRPTLDLKNRIKNLNVEIRGQIFSQTPTSLQTHNILKPSLEATFFQIFS